MPGGPEADNGGPTTWIALGIVGAVATASFPWVGHGAATEGAVGWGHLAAGIVYDCAPGIWRSALVGLLVFLRAARLGPELTPVLHGALHRFSDLHAAGRHLGSHWRGELVVPRGS